MCIRDREGIDTMKEYSENKRRIIAELGDIKEKERAHAPSVIYKPKDEVRSQFKSVQDLVRSDADDDAKRAAFGSIVERVVYSKLDDSVSIFFYL